MSRPDFVLQTFIRCTPDVLWDALIDPGQIARYHFLSGRVLKEGDTYSYERPDGSVMMRMRDVKIDPKSRIEQTFEPGWDDVPPSRTVFLIAAEGDHCSLTIEHYDLHFPVAPGEGVADGWSRWASGLKTWLETGTPWRFAQGEDAA